MPDALLDQWGTTGSYIFPMQLPGDAPPGTYTLTARAWDAAGNVTTASATATVVSTLSKFNVYLMPNWNFISTPLVPTNSYIATMVTGMPGIDAIWYYDASETGVPEADRWHSYAPGAPYPYQ